MSVDTKKAHDLAEGIYRYTSRNDNAAKMIDELAYEVDLLRKQNWGARQKIGTLEQEVDRLMNRLAADGVALDELLQAAKVVQRGDSDSDKPYKALREVIEACKPRKRKYIDLCREQLIELLEAKSKGVDHEDE